MPAPNILLIITDQQRWDALSCVSDWVKTPNMDRPGRRRRSLHQLHREFTRLCADTTIAGHGSVSAQHGRLE